MSFFSIIIPTYNSSRTISSCLESVSRQTFTDFEILIMDGCSFDNTLNIIKNQFDCRIKVFSEKDIGVYDAMNKGVLKASGKWLYFLGSDDMLYDKDVLRNVANYITIWEADMVYGNVKMTKEGNIYDGEFSIDKLYTQYNICHQAIFYRREVFEKTGLYNLRYKIWADWDLNIRWFSNPMIKTSYLNHIICLYNNNNGLSIEIDNEFSKFLPVTYLNERNKLTEEINHLRISINVIINSRAFKLAKILSQPLRFFKALFKTS